MTKQFDPFDPFSPHAQPSGPSVALNQQPQPQQQLATSQHSYGHPVSVPQNFQRPTAQVSEQKLQVPSVQITSTPYPAKDSLPSMESLTMHSDMSPQSDITTSPQAQAQQRQLQQEQQSGIAQSFSYGDVPPSPSPAVPTVASGPPSANGSVGLSSNNTTDGLLQATQTQQQLQSQQSQAMVPVQAPQPAPVGRVSVDGVGTSMAHNVTITKQYSYNVTSSMQSQPQQHSVPVSAPGVAPIRPPTYPQAAQPQPPSQQGQYHHQQEQQPQQLPPKSPSQRNMSYQNNSYGHHQGQMQRRPSNSNISSVGSSASYASSAAYSSRSVFGDKTFAPPPEFPKSLALIKAQYLNQTPRNVASTLPAFHEIKHSGEVMARFSIKSMLMKKWRTTFWITYGKNQMLFFRSKHDFDEWVSNPFLEKTERDKLVKLNVDYKNDVYKPGLKLKGYEATPVKVRGFNRDGNLCHFKLERWYSYGPSVLAAFGGQNENEVRALHRIILEMIFKAGHGKNGAQGYGSEGTNSSYFGSESQSVRDAHTSNVGGSNYAGSNYGDSNYASSNYGGSNYGGGYLSDAARSSRSAPGPLQSTQSSDYTDLLLESARFHSMRKEPEVPPMPTDGQYYDYNSEYNPIPANQDQSRGLVRSGSWRDKLSRGKSASKRSSSAHKKPNASNFGGPGANQAGNKMALRKPWKKKGDDPKERGSGGRRSKSMDPDKGRNMGSGKKRSFRLKKKKDDKVQFYVGGSPVTGAHPMPSYSMDSQFR